jgi:hypothetical protein
MDRRQLFVGLGALALSSCATPPQRPLPVAITPGAGPAELEPVYAVTAARDRLTVRVESSGCTTKADFAFFVERKGGATTVAFARKKLDVCRTVQAGHADIEFTLAELGLAPDTPVFVLNPFNGL